MKAAWNFFFAEQHWSPSETRKTRQTMKRIITLAMISVPFLIVSGPSQLFRMPCFPGHLVYFLFKPCANPDAPWRIFPDRVASLIIVMVVVWISLTVFVSAIMEIIIYSTLHCYCLVNYQFLFLRNSILDKNVPRIVQMYKELQLLITNYNLIHGGTLSVLVTILLSSSLILASYLVLGLSMELTYAQCMRFSFLTFDSFIVMLFCDGGFKANVNIVSQGILKKMKASSLFMQNRALRRHVKSWPLARIKLGSTNFYDKETPLNLIGFCVSQVVNLLLL